jgi:hypothetical protein
MTDKWIKTEDGERSTLWIDRQLRFPVRTVEDDETGELRNIKIGPQPASLFQVPAGYKKVNP